MSSKYGLINFESKELDILSRFSDDEIFDFEKMYAINSEIGYGEFDYVAEICSRIGNPVILGKRKKRLIQKSIDAGLLTQDDIDYCLGKLK